MRNYNSCLDLIKGFACVFVVWMHCEFPGELGVAVQAISRFSVPFFFMVSGFFSSRINYSKENNTKRTNIIVNNYKVKHIAVITFWSCLFYLAWTLFRFFAFRDVSLSISKSEIVIWLLFNQPAVIAGHLWFLFALLYVYIFVSIIDNTKAKNYQYILGLVALVALYILGQAIHVFGIRFYVPGFIKSFVNISLPETVSVPNFLYRNWLIEGFAFFMLGRWLKENGNNLTMSNRMVIILFVVSSILCLVERKLMGRDFGVNIFTLPQVLSLFLYAINNPNGHEGFMQRIGRDCSMIVYIVHIFIWQVLAIFYRSIGLDSSKIALYLLPVLVVIFSIALSVMYNRIIASRLTLKKR